jgi:hypothetical protein
MSRTTIPTVKVETVVPAVRQNVAFKTSGNTSYLAKPDETWDWEDLRNYVIHEIERRHGAQPRDSRKEFGIFNSFMNRWGSQAVPIARFAFEISDGRWMGAPIKMTRFCKESDKVFGSVIAEKLVA